MLLFDVFEQYGLMESIQSVDRFGRGIVNRTYLAKSKTDAYILQMINNDVFKKPEEVIKNIEQLIPYCENNKNHFLFTNALLPSLKGTFHVPAEETFWRVYKLMPHAKIFKKIINDELMEEIGCAVGKFHSALEKFDPKLLSVTIPHYHNAPKLYEKLYKVINQNYEKAVPLFNETKFLELRENSFTLIPHLLKTKMVPYRVTHNNFRLSNLLFHDTKFQCLGVIGLDAIMPGTMITDFGDAVRYFCSTAREDETQLEFVKINLDHFRLFVRGFLKQVKSFITPMEQDYLVDAVKVVTLENIIRYLTAHLDPKSKCPTDYQDQNWDRAKNQVQLLTNIEANIVLMKEIVREEKAKLS